MTKRNLFATLAALCAFAAFFCGCDHALSEQGASISIALPQKLVDGMARYAMPQFAMSRQAADAGGGAGIIRIELRGDITRTEDFAWNGVEKSLTCNIDNLPIGATVTVDASAWVGNVKLYETKNPPRVRLTSGPNSTSVTLTPVEAEPEPQPAEDVYRLKVTVEGVERTDNETITMETSGVSATAVLYKNDVQINGNFTWYDNGPPSEQKNMVVGSYAVTDLAQGENKFKIVAADVDNPNKTVEFNFSVVYAPPPPPKLTGTITHSPTETNITKGTSVTFSYTSDNTSVDSGRATVFLTFSENISGISGGGRRDEIGKTFEGPGGSVTLTFNEVGTYTITNAHAELQGYQNSDPVTFTFTVADPSPSKLTGTVDASKQDGSPLTADGQTNSVTRGTYVTFSYNGTDVSDAAIVVSGLTNWTTSHGTITSGGIALTPNGGQVTGSAGKTVIVTFNSGSVSSSPYTITAYATSDGLQSDSREYRITIEEQQPETYTITIDDATASIDGIKALSGDSHTVAVTGTLDDAALNAIASALKAVSNGTTVSLDLSGTTRLTSIDSHAFRNCTSLTSVTIPTSVTSIGSQAFQGCTSLTSVTIPDSVTSIGSYAFQGCTALTSITIPDSVTSIDGYAFSGCTSLAQVRYNGTLVSWCAISFSGSLSNPTYYAHNLYINGKSLESTLHIPDGVTSIVGSAFSGCTSLTSVTIPASVTSIGNDAFSGCTSLTSVTIPASVESMGESAFSACTSLANVTFASGSKLTSIVIDAFGDCTSLTSVTIPDSVTSIGPQAFQGCTSLTSVTIPDSVTSIGNNAFIGCTALTSVTFETTSGWRYYTDAYQTNTAAADVSFPSTNASNLKNTFGMYTYWTYGLIRNP